jgi:peptide/nickel transport system permease protein
MRRAGLLLLGVVVVAALGAPYLAPNPPDRRFGDHLYAPPTPVRVLGGTSGPYIYPLRLVNRLERRFDEDRARPASLRFFAGGRLISIDEDAGPLLLFGADGYGRDIFARLLYGARVSLLLAFTAAALAVAGGVVAGGLAGYAGGFLDEILSRTSDFILVLPAIHVALALRAAVPLVLPDTTVFVLLAAIFGLLGWPIVARGVRAIVSSEARREYVMAGRSLGAGPVRLLVRHLLPAARGYVLTQVTLLVPAFILAEATLSFVGLGFPPTTPTWGTMLQDASNVAMLGDAPWTLAPGAAIFVVVLGANLAVQGSGRAPVQLES